MSLVSPARSAISLAFVVSVAMALPATADPWPHRKPGLWQMTVSFRGAPMPPMSSKYCVDAATESALMSAGQNAANKMCGGTSIHVTGGSGTIDATCKFGGMTTTSHTVITFVGNSAYHGETRSHISPAPAYAHGDQVTTNDAKWVGPCPANMKPGDVVMANGMRMHLDPNAMQMRTSGQRGQ